MVTLAMDEYVGSANEFNSSYGQEGYFYFFKFLLDGGFIIRLLIIVG